jgi:hypothetical protein
MNKHNNSNKLINIIMGTLLCFVLIVMGTIMPILFAIIRYAYRYIYKKYIVVEMIDSYMNQNAFLKFITEIFPYGNDQALIIENIFLIILLAFGITAMIISGVITMRGIVQYNLHWRDCLGNIFFGFRKLALHLFLGIPFALGAFFALMNKGIKTKDEYGNLQPEYITFEIIGILGTLFLAIYSFAYVADWVSKLSDSNRYSYRSKISKNG